MQRDCSDLRLFRNRQRVVNLDAEIANGALELGVAEKKLDRTQVAGALVDEGCLRPAERVRAIGFRIQTDQTHPFIHEPCVLARTEVPVRSIRLWKRYAGE